MKTHLPHKGKFNVNVSKIVNVGSFTWGYKLFRGILSHKLGMYHFSPGLSVSGKHCGAEILHPCIVSGLSALRLAPLYKGQTSGTSCAGKASRAAHLSRSNAREREGMAALFIGALKVSFPQLLFCWDTHWNSLTETSWCSWLSRKMKLEEWWDGRSSRFKSQSLRSRASTLAMWPWAGILRFLNFCWTICGTRYWCLFHRAVRKIGGEGGLVRAGSHAVFCCPAISSTQLK